MEGRPRFRGRPWRDRVSRVGLVGGFETDPPLHISGFDYELPDDAVARSPAARRDGSRLLVLDRANGDPVHHLFSDLPLVLAPGDLLVLNDTRVRPVRLLGRRRTGGRVETLLLTSGEGGMREAFLRCGGSLAPGEEIPFEEGAIVGRLVRRVSGGRWLLDFGDAAALEEALDDVGRAPLPPYIARDPHQDAAGKKIDLERYQTVYARVDGAVAAPTAGLHFTHELLDRCAGAGIGVATVTLHVGPGTFVPVRCEEIEDHRMEEEWFEVPARTLEAVLATRERGRRVVAVGTTACRALESAAARLPLPPRGRETGITSYAAALEGVSGVTDLFLRPGSRFSWVDGLITNFHLPRSTLLMLVCALAGRERVLAAYREALDRGYRFYSFGDAMLLL